MKRSKAILYTIIPLVLLMVLLAYGTDGNHKAKRIVFEISGGLSNDYRIYEFEEGLLRCYDFSELRKNEAAMPDESQSESDTMQAANDVGIVIDETEAENQEEASEKQGEFNFFTDELPKADLYVMNEFALSEEEFQEICDALNQNKFWSLKDEITNGQEDYSAFHIYAQAGKKEYSKGGNGAGYGEGEDHERFSAIMETLNRVIGGKVSAGLS